MQLWEYTGFTPDEVQALCQLYDMPFENTKKWYDGYNVRGLSIYNPRSVVMSMTGHDFDSYWTQTETYTYDFDTKQVWIPNKEVRQEFINCIEDGGWEPVINAVFPK